MKKVYFMTSCLYNPSGWTSDPLCQVWIGQANDHTQVFSKVYRSYNLPKMLKLANKLARERNIPMTALSVDPWIEEIYTQDPVP